VAREKEAQLAAIRAEEEEPVAVAGRMMRERLLEGHPYAFRRNGTLETLQALGRKHLLEYRDRWMVARNGVLAVFGDVDAQEVDREVEALLGGLRPGEAGHPSLAEPLHLGAPVEVRGTMDKQQSVLFVGYRGADLFSPDRTALDLLDEACSDLGSRMFIRIREQLGLAYFVGSSQLVGLSPGAFSFYLGTDPLKQTAVLAELLDEIRQLAEQGLTLEELNRAKEKWLGALEIRNQSLDALALGCALDELYGLGAEHYLVVRDRVRTISLEEVREVARRYFGAQSPVVAVVGPGS
jgi:zinc protease